MLLLLAGESHMLLEGSRSSSRIYRIQVAGFGVLKADARMLRKARVYIIRVIWGFILGHWKINWGLLFWD